MKTLLWILAIFVPVYAIAQMASPTPGASPLVPLPLPTPDSNPGLVPTITGLISLARGWQSMGFFVAIATALKYVVDASQLSFIGAPFSKIPVKYQLLVRSFIAAVIALLGFMAGGAPFMTALVAAVETGAGSGFIHEVLADFIPAALPPSGQPPVSGS